VPVVGFDAESGILVHPEARTPENVPFSNAMDYLGALLANFRFITEGDRARAVWPETGALLRKHKAKTVEEGTAIGVVAVPSRPQSEVLG
jgi:hypothetical protein